MRSLIGSLTTKLANKSPVSYSSGRDRGTFSWNGYSADVRYMSSMGSVGTLFAIVNGTSTATSAVNWHLYRKSATGKPEDRVEVMDHLALRVWNKPNDFYTRQEFVETEQQHIDLTGEGWWCVSYYQGTNIPQELWPMRPDRITVVESAKDFISGYIYTSPSGERVPLERSQVIQIRMPNPLDPYRGMGPVQSVLTDLETTKYSAEYAKNFFVNGAEPGGIIQVEKRLSDPEWEEMRLRWTEQHKGIANAHKVAILEQGQWVDRKYTNKDMQFTELRGMSRDVIREAFGVTKFDVGDIDDVNRATADASETRWAKRIVIPRLDRFKRALNNDFLPLFGSTGQGVEFDYDSPIPEDEAAENAERDSKAASFKLLMDAGVDVEAAAKLVGYPPNTITLRPLPEPVAPVVPQAEPVPTPPAEESANG